MLLTVIFPAGAFAQPEVKTTAATTDESVIGVSYRGHVQNYGNMPKPEGTMIAGPEALGTTGEGLRLEGFWIDLTGDVPANGGINYAVHVQNIGWQDAVDSGDFAGTNARGLRIEAIKISLKNLPDYDVYYRGHVQNVGNIPQVDGDWGWVKNGEELGTTGKGQRLEELQVKIVRKGIDLTAYNTLLDTIEKLDAANYSPESWATLQTALTQNKMTEANSQTSIDAATQAIQAAYDALSLKVVAVYDKPGIYGPETGSQTIEGSVIIDVSGVTLQNLVIKGDLTVSEAVGDGDATLNNLTVEGTTILAGGGTGGATLAGLATSGEMALAANSGGITIDGGKMTKVLVTKNDHGGIRITVSSFRVADVQVIDIPEGQPIILDGWFKSVTIQVPDLKLEVAAGTIVDRLTAGSADPQKNASGLAVSGSGIIDQFNVFELSDNVSVGAGIGIGTAYIYGDNAQFSGKVGSADIYGDNAGFKIPPDEYTGHPPVIINPPAPPPGGGGGVSTTPVTAVAISGDAVVGQTLTATTTPSGATVTYQWMRCDTAGGTYTSISGATSNTYTLQSGASGDAGQYIKVQVTGNGSYSGTVVSNGVGQVTPATVLGASDITIGTTAPVSGAAMADGTNTFEHASAEITWASGGVYAPASGNYAAATTYTTKYIVTAASGYKFDNTAQVYEVVGAKSIAEKIIGETSFTATVSTVVTTDDTLTIVVTWPTTETPATVLGANDITIGTVAPVKDAAMADGTNTFTHASALVTWANGGLYAPASGNYAAATTYTTKYIVTAASGYKFDKTDNVYEVSGSKSIAEKITGENSFTATVSTAVTTDDTLTIVVTWPETEAEATVLVENDITIGTVAPVKDAAMADGTNTFAHASALVTWANGGLYASASGNYAAATTYTTKYIVTAASGYKFDKTDNVYEVSGSKSIAEKITGENSFTAIVSTEGTTDDTLTIVVTWTATESGSGLATGLTVTAGTYNGSNNTVPITLSETASGSYGFLYKIRSIEPTAPNVGDTLYDPTGWENFNPPMNVDATIGQFVEVIEVDYSNSDSITKWGFVEVK